MKLNYFILSYLIL